MNITWHGENKIEIKTKNAVINTGEKILINDVELSGPGEYEVAGIEAVSSTQSIYQFRIEDIGVAYLDSLDRILTDAEIEALSDASILIIPVGGGKVLDPKKAVQMIKSIEPKVVIPIEMEDTKAFCDLIGGCAEPLAVYKITKQQLAEVEGQAVVLLTKT